MIHTIFNNVGYVIIISKTLIGGIWYFNRLFTM